MKEEKDISASLCGSFLFLLSTSLLETNRLLPYSVLCRHAILSSICAPFLLHSKTHSTSPLKPIHAFNIRGVGCSILEDIVISPNLVPDCYDELKCNKHAKSVCL